jgi:hypothetical protein
MVAVLKLLAGGAAIHLPAQTFGAAMLDRPHREAMRGQEFVHIFFSIVSAIRLKEVSQF